MALRSRSQSARLRTSSARNRPPDVESQAGALSLSTLGATLWPELDGAAAHNACHVAIHRLRKVLGDESAIRITQGLVALNGRDAWIDVEVFRRFAARIRTALAAGAARAQCRGVGSVPHCRAILTAGLGVEPSQETRALQAGILRL